MDWIREQAEWIALGAAGLSLALMVWIVAIQAKLNKLRKRYAAMMNGGRPGDLEELLISMQEETNRLKEDLRKTKSTLAHWQERVRALKGFAAVRRYNAYGEGGHDLSFSIAVLDEERNGFVLTGIRNREETYVYAKPVDRGDSSYTLSPEEKQAIEQAMAQPASGAGR
ncbi:DUF4446 family protein [Paenibacillus thermoaerophilus]|uniref:DUF4446 family protein n=1 Tax=Paenibacillus thermoaerophilus TaxID=1215385 RepID=A0ABW2UZW1_9BACL|nr:DUF4446 family protein [Paenibacillus thermoaerophilus]